MTTDQIVNKLKNIFGLSFQLFKADLKSKDQWSYFGVLRSNLEPILMFFILLNIRNIVGKEIEYYPIYLFLGLIMFNFFRSMTVQAVDALTKNSDLITSFKINQEVFIISLFIKSTVSHFFEIVVMVILMIYFKLALINLIFYFLIFAFLSLFVLGVSFVVAILGVYFNSFNESWRVLTRLLWLATPTFYASKLPLKNLFFDLNFLNPIYYFLTSARNMIINNVMPELKLFLGMILFSLITFIFGLIIFEKTKDNLVEKL